MKKITVEFDDEDADQIIQMIEKLMALIEEQKKEDAATDL
jgi:Holliday junction resolvasome RuvABC endonuclease subunit|tara:strand:- start:530 stop:649 length:120 start_codon:yes stop_codon:yes gene_type:complete